MRPKSRNGRPRFIGGWSGRFAEGGHGPLAEWRESRTSSMWARWMAGCGRATITGAPGIRSSITSRPSRSARLLWLRPTAVLCMWPAAKGCIGPIFPWATAFTGQTMRGRPGSTWVCAMANRFPRWRSIRTTRTGFLPRCWVILTVPMRSAEFTVRRMAARVGRRCSTRTRTRAGRMWRSILCTRMWCTRRFGSRGLAPGKTATSTTAPRADCSNPPTAAIPGAS